MSVAPIMVVARVGVSTSRGHTAVPAAVGSDWPGTQEAAMVSNLGHSLLCTCLLSV